MHHADNVHLARPGIPTGTGVLVLAGSSGRLDSTRADLLARHGATALALRWFGGPGQPSTPCEVPLETFTRALDLMAGECTRLAILGLSYGAEAALLTAVRDPRVAAVVAISPSDVAWEGHRDHDSDAPRSKWTWRGEPVPFVPMCRVWEPEASPVAFTPWYEASRRAAGDSTVAAASVPVEQFTGELVLVAGGDDQVWPSLAHAESLATLRSPSELPTVLVTDPGAGHQVVLPGEGTLDGRRAYAVGGNAGSARRLGELAWPAIREALHLQ